MKLGTIVGENGRKIRHYCRVGILKRAKLKGKIRANGVTEESLEKALAGETVETATTGEET